MPESAPRVSGVATCNVVARKLTAISSGGAWPWPSASVTPISTRMASRINRKRLSDILAPPSPGQYELGTAGADAIDVADDRIGGHKEQDERLDHRDNINRHLGQKLHPRRAVAQHPE